MKDGEYRGKTWKNMKSILPVTGRTVKTVRRAIREKQIGIFTELCSRCARTWCTFDQGKGSSAMINQASLSSKGEAGEWRA